MQKHRWRSDGRRCFSAEFKREQMARMGRNELTLVELSRRLDVDPSVIRHWKHLIERGGEMAVAACQSDNRLQTHPGLSGARYQSRHDLSGHHTAPSAV